MQKQIPVTFTLAACAALLAGCAANAPATPTASPAAVLPKATGLKLGQRAYADGPIIEAVSIIEDSRCPQNARCVWAGALKVQMIWHRPTGEAKAFVAELGKAVPLADGALQITSASPPQIAGAPKRKPEEYRFDFLFQGGY